MDATARLGELRLARTSEIAWSWPPDAGVKLCELIFAK